MQAKPFVSTTIILLLLILHISTASITRKLSTIVGSTDESVPFMYNVILPQKFMFHPKDETLVYFTTETVTTYVSIKLLNLTSGQVTDAVPNESIFQTMDFTVDGETSDIYYISQGLVYKYSASTKTKSLFAGGGYLDGNYIPANQAKLENPWYLDIDLANGDLIIAESRKIKRVRDRIINTVAGGGK